MQKNGHDANSHDLHKENFDPILPLNEFSKDVSLNPEIDLHSKEIIPAYGIIVIHPNWRGQPPAVLKGWADRVIRPGAACEFLEGDGGEGIPRGFLMRNQQLSLIHPILKLSGK